MQVMCYGSDDVAIYYYDGSSWHQSFYDDNCDYPSGTGNYVHTFTINSSAEVQYVRGIVGYSTISSSCYTVTYGDNDDLNFSVISTSCTGTPDSCGTYNASQTNCERVSCDWNPTENITEYTPIGNHTELSILNWNLENETPGFEYENFRCNASDLAGTALSSEFFTIDTEFIIGGVIAAGPCACSSLATDGINCSVNCVINESCQINGTLDFTNYGEGGSLTLNGSLLSNISVPFIAIGVGCPLDSYGCTGGCLDIG